MLTGPDIENEAHFRVLDMALNVVESDGSLIKKFMGLKYARDSSGVRFARAPGVVHIDQLRGDAADGSQCSMEGAKAETLGFGFQR